jgi:hypothetical protein
MNLSSAASRTVFSLSLAGVLAATAVLVAADKNDKHKDDKPSIQIKVNPAIGFAPFRAVLTADVKGGPDDYEQFYCATAEWDMGDGNKAEQGNDCDPYEAGKSQIKRRYVREQIFDTPGEYHVMFRLKQKNKVVGAGQTVIRVRPGIRDGGMDDRGGDR